MFSSWSVRFNLTILKAGSYDSLELCIHGGPGVVTCVRDFVEWCLHDAKRAQKNVTGRWKSGVMLQVRGEVG